jgi:excisionase family DNA binding protein
MNETQKRLYTLEEAGTYLGRSKHTVKEMVREGKIPVVKYDRRVFIDLHDMDELIEATKKRRRGEPRPPRPWRTQN